jgi:chromosome segregation ATPase
MKNFFKNYGVFAALGLVILVLGIYIMFMPDRKPEPPKLSNIEQQLNSHLWDLQVEYKAMRGKVDYYTSVIDQKNKQLADLKNRWMRSHEAMKELTTDERMAYVQGFFECPDLMRKVLIGKDTAIILTVGNMAELGYICNDFEYQSIMIDSLMSMIGSYSEQVSAYQGIVDNLNKQVAVNNDRVAVKDDKIAALENQIADIKKEAKRAKRRAFFRGLGFGAVGGFIGGIIVIL